MHGLVVRTYAQDKVAIMAAAASRLHVINALSDELRPAEESDVRSRGPHPRRILEVELIPLDEILDASVALVVRVESRAR